MINIIWSTDKDSKFQIPINFSFIHGCLFPGTDTGQPGASGQGSNSGQTSDEGWGQWGQWSPCSTQCTQSRTRDCTYNTPGAKSLGKEGGSSQKCQGWFSQVSEKSHSAEKYPKDWPFWWLITLKVRRDFLVKKKWNKKSQCQKTQKWRLWEVKRKVCK